MACCLHIYSKQSIRLNELDLSKIWQEYRNVVNGKTVVGEPATLEPLHEHLYEYKTLMFQKYGAGVQACYPCILLILAHFKGLHQNIHLTQPSSFVSIVESLIYLQCLH